MNIFGFRIKFLDFVFDENWFFTLDEQWDWTFPDGVVYI